MKLGGSRNSSNVEDRRGMGGPLMAGGGIGGVVLLVLYVLLGGDPSDVATQMPQTGGQQTQASQPGQPDEMRDFIEKVVGETEDVWTGVFREQLNSSYQPPKLVLFSNAVQSGCGTASSAAGPFYCPLDQKVYIDLAFYQQLRDRFNAPGDFAQAYVIAHEVGHHVQTLTGISERVQNARQRVSEREGNQLSVRQELQADCYAGLWAKQANQARQILEAGDVEEGLAAASAIGDDNIQKQTTGTIRPESFTHGSAEQRVSWFKRGLESGSVAQCDTFSQ